MASELRAVGDRVLVVRVQPGSELIRHVGETMGVTDRVLQFGEVVGLGTDWVSGNLRRLELAVGDLVVYPSPRIYDQFRQHLPGKGAVQIAVIPGYWISAVVHSGWLAEHPECREYGALLE